MARFVHRGGRHGWVALGGKRLVEAHGRRIACVDTGRSDGGATGDGPTFLFLHGNPPSSYVWRWIIPHVEGMGRCVAVDLLGMGDSDKLPASGPGSYNVAQQIRYLDAAFDALDLGDRVVLVVHEWGSVFGFDWARRHPGRVAGIAHMDAILGPWGWSDQPEAFRQTIEMFRSPAGEEMVLQRNQLLEMVIGHLTVRDRPTEEWDEYRRPFLEPGESRRPILDLPRQLPIEDDPPDVVAICRRYAEWLASSPVPKLFVRADPGVVVTPRLLEVCRTWPEQQEITLPGSSFILEEKPDEVGRALADWTRTMVGVPTG